jgi:hypothetical protein
MQKYLADLFKKARRLVWLALGAGVENETREIGPTWGEGDDSGGPVGQARWSYWWAVG